MKLPQALGETEKTETQDQEVEGRDGKIIKDLVGETRESKSERRERKEEGGLCRRRSWRVIRAHTPESQSVWTLPTKSIKNSLGQYWRKTREWDRQRKDMVTGEGQRAKNSKH